ncbi:MAG TPA: hypothetical protein VG733_08380 [Chthoniobacteraceae bacterium]|nr:hypothetical protein [Chthoniobacteraceae bacterium]
MNAQPPSQSKPGLALFALLFIGLVVMMVGLVLTLFFAWSVMQQADAGMQDPDYSHVPHMKLFFHSMNQMVAGSVGTAVLGMGVFAWSYFAIQRKRKAAAPGGALADNR